MPYKNRWPYASGVPEAPDAERCQFGLPDGTLCGLGRYPGFEFCIFHLPINAERPDDIVLCFALQEAVLNNADLFKANLQGARLEGANLQGANLGIANLQGAKLSKANLQGAWLLVANLQEAWLWGANLQEAWLWGANLRGARLRDASLQGAGLPGANLQGADLEFVRITGSADLWRADLSDADLKGATISADTDLDRVTWGPNNIIKLEEPDREYHDAERVYRQIKRSYEESGQYDKAGDFYVREMECRRKALQPWSIERFFFDVVWWLCGYGEMPGRTALAALVTVVYFAILHAILGVEDGGMPGIAHHNPLTALYFSIVTFTSLGYGDLQPLSGLGRFYAAVEVAIGVFIMALFLYCFVRKWGRG